ncbi:complement factor B [Paramisgurnus dabryanus]|uniref:complement factor B n=1 Tax=Paramisgurnus dabryanus TaxID=90735 RepID=UPI0031F375F5
MACKLWLNWLMLALICPLIIGARSSTGLELCPTVNLSITGGSFVLSNEYFSGSTLKYRCPVGFYPSVKTRICQNTQWNPPATLKKPAECKKITCPNPRVLENGEIAPYKDRYYVNDTTTYTCHSDFTFRGSKKRTCLPNGKWSGDTPVCGRDSDHCPDPGVPPGTQRTGQMFNIEDIVTYRCDNKLTLIGSSVRMCQEGGQWTGTEPQCYADFTYDTPEEASQSFSSSLKTNLEINKQYEETDQAGKQIRLDQGGKLDIYIALDASDSIEKSDFDTAKIVIKTLIDKISYYQVSPNYEILMFASDVTPIITMRNYKSVSSERNLIEIFERLDNFTYESKGERSGSNIAKAFSTILDSMGVEKQNNMTQFLETQHIVIMFTDGHANMGGNPKPKVENIKHFVTQKDPSRDNKLEVYVFGVGSDINKEDINDWVTKRDNEKFFFNLPNLQEVQETFDQMIDDSTSVELCGIQHDYTKNRRHAFPWLAQIKILRSSGMTNCMGSLVTSSYILTAAHCFKFEDHPDSISIDLKKHLSVKVARYIVHPRYNITAKRDIGIKEYYEFDVALIQLTKAVELDRALRTICIPCTVETSAALKLTENEVTCKKHEEIIMGPDLVNANFTSDMKTEDNTPKAIRTITIKQRGMRDACVEDAMKADLIKDSTNPKLTAKDVVTDNFLCSGGMTTSSTDNVACKGDSGGATYLHKNDRVIQVGVVSWGSKEMCKDNKENQLSKPHTRDYHTNLFSPEVRSFLAKYLGPEEERKGTPLTFLPI